MKSILITMLSVIASISFAQTKTASSPSSKKATSFSREYGLAGCGLGSVVMGKKGGQISAATTNGTSFNQIFGITAGTLNCVDSASAEVASRIDQFILVNRSQIQGDVARGNGETIAALSTYMGCESDSKQIGQELKSNYSAIFNDTAKANEITDSIITVILKTPTLAQKCGNLS